MSDYFLIVGLGNPGFRYKKTRHNIGFMAIDTIVKSINSSLKSNAYMSTLYTVNHGDSTLVYVKPLTYMNRSGLAVSAIAKDYNIHPDHILIIYDDVSLEFGRIRIRGKGSSGGHNGLESIIQEMDTSGIPRLRIGIGSEKLKNNMVHFVLSKFSRAERKELTDILEHVNSAVNSFINDGLEKSMSIFNAKPKHKSYQEE